MQSLWNAALAKNSSETLKELNDFAVKNTWNAEESQSISDWFLASLSKLTDSSRILILLPEILVALEPGACLLQHFEMFNDILKRSIDLRQNQAVLEMVTVLFQVHVPTFSAYEKRLVTAVSKYLDLYVAQIDKPWRRPFPIERMHSDIMDDKKLESAIFCFGNSNPGSFFDLLNVLALNPSSRLASFFLLRSFISLENSPTYLIADSELKNTVFMSALLDSDFGTKLTAVNILTILLPYLTTIIAAELPLLLNVLVGLIEWDSRCEELIANITSPQSTSPEVFSLGEEVDDVLKVVSSQSTKRMVTQYFRVLYGMVPCNLLHYISICRNGPLLPPNNRDFQIVDDPLPLAQSAQDWSEKQEVLLKCFHQLLEQHKFNIKSLGLDHEAELRNPWFLNQSAANIALFCDSLQVPHLFGADSSSCSDEIPDGISGVTKMVLQVNKLLYGPVYKHCYEHQNPISSDSALALKIFYIVVTNESFFRECMRLYHISSVKVHRKNEIKRIRQSLVSKDKVTMNN